MDGSDKQKHIMISYNWDVQPKMLELKEFLESNGINIWMDVADMGTEMPLSMADAVENAALVLVAMTEKYQKSRPCYKEANYADQNKVPIVPLLLQRDYNATGWLGFLMTGRKYVDLSSDQYKQKFGEVLVEVRRSLNTTNPPARVAKQAVAKFTDSESTAGAQTLKEYCGDDEVDDDATDDVNVELKKEIVSTTDIETKMKEMGFNRKRTIVVFDDKYHFLHRFDIDSKSLTRMHSYTEDFESIVGVTFDEYIYMLDDVSFSNYRLKYCDVTATLEKMSWPDGMAMFDVTASSNAIFLVSLLPDRFVYKYDPPLDRWERLPGKLIEGCNSAVYSNGFLYCITRKSNTTVERLNLETMKWERMADTYIRGDHHVAVECGENIYVIGCNGISCQTRIIYIEKYYPKVDKWAELKPVASSHLLNEIIVNAFGIDGNLYIVAETRILKYDVKKNELGILASIPDIDIIDAVLVRMSD